MSEDNGETIQPSSLPEWCGLDAIGGKCPVQAEGTLAGAFWYFRARGSAWSITVHVDRGLSYYYSGETPLYHYEEAYGKKFEAGYMPIAEAEAFILRELTKYRDSLPKETP